MTAVEEKAKTVLIVDQDLGYVFWLGGALDAAGYAALPAKSPPEAALLIIHLGLEIDVLIIDLKLAGAMELVRGLCRSRPGLKVIASVSDPLETSATDTVDVSFPKPSIFDENAKYRWLRSLRGFLGDPASVGLV